MHLVVYKHSFIDGVIVMKTYLIYRIVITLSKNILCVFLEFFILNVISKAKHIAEEASSLFITEALLGLFVIPVHV